MRVSERERKRVLSLRFSNETRKPSDLIILKLLFNDDKVRLIQALISKRANDRRANMSDLRSLRMSTMIITRFMCVNLL
jgi:hypothetical protein